MCLLRVRSPIILELEDKENIVVLSPFENLPDKRNVSHVFFDYSAGNDSVEGRWAYGPSIDRKAAFSWHDNPRPFCGVLHLEPAPAYLHDMPLEVVDAANNPPKKK